MKADLGPSRYLSGHTTHTGCIRDHNEDRYYADDRQGLWIVADGMGGHRAGEVASGIVVDVVPKAVVAGASLAKALRQANQTILQLAAQGESRRGMGSTAVVLRIDQQQFEIAWVGDSRAYLWDGHRLKPLTRDHSLVQELVDVGSITPAEALVHPHRHLITRAVGLEAAPFDIETSTGALRPDEKILLCTDGLNTELEDPKIAEILAAGHSEQDATDQLIQAALKKGGHDNVTVMLVAARSKTL